MNTPTFGLTGRVQPAVVNRGRVLHTGAWTRNLWLDAGLNRMAETPICDCFAVAVKGTGTTPTLEDLSGTANTYSITSGTSTLTRTAGTRDFVAGDIGKLLRFSTTPFAEFTITAVNSVSSVEVTPNASAGVANKKVLVYGVQQTGLAAETGRTAIYSTTAGENRTATAGNVRTFTRTFLFPTESVLVETVPADNTFSQTASVVTRESGTRDFSAGDVGATIRFLNSGVDAAITAFIDTTNVTVGVSQTVPEQPIKLTKPNSAKVETPNSINTFSRAGSTVTRATGVRNFSADDVGKIIHFDADNMEATITAYTDAAHVTVDTSGALAAQTARLYGFTDYTEIGFSHSLETAPNLNVRVLLDAPVRVYVATPLRASDQLKVAYECQLTVTPNTAATGTLAGVISDPDHLMSGNKSGKSAIESFATSTVSPDGDTDISFPDLEPFYPGYAALSLSSDALAPLTGKTRENGTVSVELDADPYTPGDFSRTYQALFGLNDAVSNSWRSLMTYDPDTRSAIFTFLYDVAQKKDGEHTFAVTFRKTWGRDLA